MLLGTRSSEERVLNNAERDTLENPGLEEAFNLTQYQRSDQIIAALVHESLRDTKDLIGLFHYKGLASSTLATLQIHH